FLPVLGFAPRLYGWFVRRRFRQLYQRLRVIESSLQARLTPSEVYRKGDDDRSDASLRSVFHVAISPRSDPLSSHRSKPRDRNDPNDQKQRADQREANYQRKTVVRSLKSYAVRDWHL